MPKSKATEEVSPRPLTIALINNKGGSGKTTSAVNIAAGFARLGTAALKKKKIDRMVRVLLVDADAQGNASLAIYAEAGQVVMNLQPHGPTSLYDVMVHGADVQNALLRIPLAQTTAFENAEVDLFPANIRLSQAELELSGVYRREYVFAKAMNQIQNYYDVIIVDCPPSLGLITQNVLSWVEHVIVPVEPGYFALVGLSVLDSIVSRIRAEGNPLLNILGILPTRQTNTNISRDTETELVNTFGNKVFPGIPERTTVASSTASAMDLFAYAPTADATYAYGQVVKRLGGLPDSVLQPARPRKDQKETSNG